MLEWLAAYLLCKLAHSRVTSVQVEIFCGNERYFPPRSEDGSGGARYREVGFLNINWQAGTFPKNAMPFCALLLF